MSDHENLGEVVETNFRLGILFTRQMGVRLDRRVDGLGRRMDQISQTTGHIAEGLGELAERTSKLAKEMTKVSKGLDRLATDTKAFGSEIRTDFDALADRQEETLIVLQRLGASNVDYNKDLAELKRRVTELENKDKAS